MAKEVVGTDWHHKRFELILAAVGVVVTILLGLNQNRLSDRQNELQKELTEQQNAFNERVIKQQRDFEERIAAQQNVLQIVAVVKDYLPLMEDSNNGERARTIISAAASHMTTKYNDPFLAELAKAILEAPKSSEAANLQIVEATLPPPPQSASDRTFFTVLASYTLFNLKEAKDEKERLRNIHKDYPAELGSSRFANSFPVASKERREESPEEEEIRFQPIRQQFSSCF